MSPRTDEMPDAPWLGTPIDARPLFGPELASLLDLLRTLGPAEWAAEAVPGWSVKDLAAHILGDYHGRLSRHTDESRPAPSPGETLEAFIHRINQEGVDFHAGDTPAELIAALGVAGAQVDAMFASLDLRSARVGVSWAGVDPAPGWLDIAREFTEYWTHRQQIRHATGRGTDPGPRALAATLDTFMRALPHTLRDTPAAPGTQVRVVVEGSSGGTWTVTAGEERWSLAPPPDGRPKASVTLDAETAWRLCTRGIEPAAALARAHIQGRRPLAEAVCRIVSVVR
ncbi:maleylpyruvate isomerase family mycothiol-dependent enzyme [Streptomyces sp. NPDC060209]|uniref:maleylpyruvate isomerase family mycothiol-dependent enzyme n=1 Tax=Streptomyces sp. NPDC060209 TaxID=3347073 RepID=UPI00364D9108